ncbi:hypothetical protein DT075_37945 [Bacillus licheniformis]|nr:hypothetical protein DT075_37945 [Bacillus licheniformis]
MIQEDQGDDEHPIVMIGPDNQKIKQDMPHRKPPEKNRAKGFRRRRVTISSQSNGSLSSSGLSCV